MPVTVELRYEPFLTTWSGRLKLIELTLAILCMACAAPAYHSTQDWFLFVVVSSFIGTGFFSLYTLCLDFYLKEKPVNWLQCEFWFSAIATFLYFTAFLAMIIEFSGVNDQKYQYWYDAQVAAGVFGMFNDVCYGLGTYFLYTEWKLNPMGNTIPSSPVPPV